MPTTKTEIEKVQTKTPGQRAAIENLLSQFSPEVLQGLFSDMMGGLMSQAKETVGGYLGPIDEEDLRQRFQRRTAEPAMRQFQEEFVPQLQERFTAAGSGGGPAEQSMLTSGATRLSEDLARQFEDVYEGAQTRQLQAAQMAGGLTAQQLQAMFPWMNFAGGEQMYQPVARQTTTQSPWESFLTAFGEGTGKAIPFMVGM